MLDFNEAQATAVIRRRLQAQSLPDHDIQERIASYLLAVSRLLQGAQVAYDLMDDDDPRREGLATCCASQIQTWLDEIAGPEPDYAVKQCSSTPSMLPRGRRHFLEEYFKLNAYPSVADKKVLARHEHASYRQIHIWFQNRRARAKATNAPLKKCAQSPAVSAAIFDQARHAAESHDHSDDELVKDETWDDMDDEASLAWAQQPSPEPVETPRARLQAEFRTSTATSTPSAAQRRSSRTRKTVDMDELISAFGAMNVRGAGTKTAIGAEKGYAARQAITYVAPKAPLPSYIPQEQLSPAPRRLMGLPKRRPAARRRLMSISSDSSNSSSEGSDRVPSLTYSDTSDSSSSSSPSPEPPIRSELLPSPPSPTWVDLPSPSFPLIVTPSGGISYDAHSSLTWREDAGAEGDDEDEAWDRASKGASLAPSKPRRRTSKQKTAQPHTKSLRSRSATESPRSPGPASHPTLPIASDELVSTGLTTAVVENGVEKLPGWAELAFLNLDVNPATAGALDIQLGSWDGASATQPASQFDFGPVSNFGDAPSAPAAEVQSEPEEQTVDESHANTDDSTWAAQLASGWNGASSLVAVDNLSFDNDFAFSAFDGFIASNWNLEPELEPTSNPSSLFGKTGFEANIALTTQSANGNASKPTFGVSVPETTFTFGSASAQSTFKFGASTAAATAFAAPASTPSTSSSTLKPTVPTSTFTFSQPATTQPTTSKASTSSPFTFGTPSTSTSTFAFSSSSTPRTSTSTPLSSSSCAPSSSSFAFGAGSSGAFTFGMAG